MRTTLLGIGILLSSILFSGCMQHSSPVSQTDKPPITIGWIGPLSGPRMALGTESLNGLKQAIQELNEEGGIQGHPIELFTEDGKCNDSSANLAAHKLINLKQVPVVFAVCSPEVLATAPLAQEQSTVLIGLLSSATTISDAGEYVFRVQPNSIVQAGFAAESGFHILDKRSASLLVEDSSWGKGLAQEFTEHFTALGGTVINEITYAPFSEDFSEQLEEIAKNAPDLLYIPTSPEAASGAATQAREFLPDSAILGSDTWAETGEALPEGVYYVRPKVGSSNTVLPNTRATFASYEAMQLLAAIMKTTGNNPDAIRAALTTTNITSPLIGPIQFDPKGDVLAPSFDLLRIQEGSAQLQ